MADSVIVVELGPNPQLMISDHLERMSRLVLDFQIQNTVKDDIWRIIQSPHPTTTKMAKLIALGLDSDLLGPIAELLLADSRCE